jgi:alpha-tubulin suppressor-like RCC1 family protein
MERFFGCRMPCLQRKREMQTRMFLPMLALLSGIAWGPVDAGTPRIEAGSEASFAIDSSGVLYGWGDDAVGQLAVGRILQSDSPARVQVAPEFVSMVGGEDFNLALDANGMLWGWGRNDRYQLGDGTPTDRLTAQPLGSRFSAVAAGASHSLALKADGTLWGWGERQFLGAAAGPANPSRPVQLGAGFSAISAGGSHSLAMKPDGSLWAWGIGFVGNIGDGSAGYAERPTPVQIGAGFKAIATSASGLHNLALKHDGSLWAWGSNNAGQLGDGTRTDRTVPVQVGTGFSAIAAGSSHSLAMKPDGALWAWGYLHGDFPQQIGAGFTAIAAGGGHSLAMKADGSLWAWGDNSTGQLGDGTRIYRAMPVQIGTGFRAIAAAGLRSMAVTADGRLFAWGFNRYGALGIDATPTRRSVPVRIGTGFRSISADFANAYALKVDDTLWILGVGSGYPGGRSVPVQVGTGFMQVVKGAGGHTLALKRDGTLLTWGANYQGQIGDNTMDHRSIDAPFQVGSGFVAIAAGFGSSFALKADGTLYAWGDDSYGQLGLGGTTARTRCFNDAPCVRTPHLVGTQFSAVSSRNTHVLALKSDRSLWTWGSNSAGQLGDGSENTRNAPVAVGSGFVSISAGGVESSMALKADGSLWAWGLASALGIAGDLDCVSTFSAPCAKTPRLLGFGFADVSAGFYFSLALKVDGSLRAVGSNNTGQLGVGTSVARANALTPVIDETGTRIFDLTPETPVDAAESLIPFFLIAEASKSDLKAILTDLRASGLQGEVYFTALLPRNSPLLSKGEDGSASDGARRASLRRDIGLPPGTGSPETRATPNPPGAYPKARRSETTAPAPGMVAGVLTRDGFKQTGGTGYGQAEAAYSGSLSTSGTLRAYEGLAVDPLAGSAAMICMGVTVPELSAKGQVLMRPIATGTAVQGNVQCPPVQTTATIAQFRSEASGPMTARTVTAVIHPLDADRGKVLKLFSWAVAPDGRQFMQTGPNQWVTMADPMQAAATITVPASGPYRLAVTNGLDLTGIEETLVFIGLGETWEQVRNFNKAGHYYTVR